MSMKITKAKLLKLIVEEIENSLVELNPSKTLADQSPEDLEPNEEDPTALRADTVLGGEAGEWQRAKDDMTPPPQRPPKEYRRQAIKILASFNVDVGQQAIDILAWELVHANASAPTQSMEVPVGKPSWLQNVLKKAIKEDLKAHMGSHNLREADQGQISAVRHFTQGMPYEVESILIQLIDRYGFDLGEAEQLAKELKRMQGSELEDKAQLAQHIKEELEAYLEEEEKNNPWAICTSSVGREDKEKYEKCVKSIKAQNRGK
jgi:hypothetical protein